MFKILKNCLSASLLSAALIFSFGTLTAKDGHGGGKHHGGKHSGGKHHGSKHHGGGGHHGGKHHGGGGHHHGGHGHHGHHNHHGGGYYNGYGYGGYNGWGGGTGFYIGVPLGGATLGASYYNSNPNYYYNDPYATGYYGTTTYYY